MKLLFILLLASFKALFLGSQYKLYFDFHNRLAKIVKPTDTVDFYIKKDHTTPFAGYVLGNEIVFVALKADTLAKNPLLNPGWWIQTYSLDGDYDTSYLYTPTQILEKGYGIIKPITILFNDTLYITFDIADCVYAYRSGKIRKIKCGLLPEIPKAKKRYSFLPEKYPRNAPRLIRFAVKKDELYIEVFRHGKTQLVKIH